MFKVPQLLSFYFLLLFGSAVLSASEKISPPEIKKSPNDDREYSHIVLNNALRVLLISDPSTDKSSASLDVNVGSATDPIDYPGLAHFLEHMLFLGTEKYPEPDAYQKYIRQHGGSHNAYTSAENTNYFFDIRPEFFEGALDRFSEQFTHPLFNAEYVEREVNAVHSEFTSKIKDDGRRFYSVLKAVLAEDHPYRRFSVGNLETLKDKGETKLRDALLDFYNKNYSANQMTLTVLGKEPLEKLRTWTVEKFSGIENKHLKASDFEQPFFDKDFLPVKVEAQSIMDKRSMMLAFPIPSSSAHPQSKPVSYLSNLIGHEGTGSLLSALKDENLVDALSAGAEFDTKINELFIMRMSLTKQGFENQNRILEIIFSYIGLLEKQGLKKLYFDEQKTMLDIAFNFQEKVEPIHFTSALSRTMQYTPASDILVERYALSHFDKALYRQYLDQLNPSNMLVTVNAKAIEGTHKTQWYNTPYSLKKFEPDFISKLTKAETNAKLKLPEKNIFIPESIAIIKNSNTEKPELLLKETGLEVWHHTDTSFGTPKSNLFVTIRSPEATKSASTLNMTEIMVDLLTDALSEYSYPAYLAGLHYELYNHMRGVTIKISGYSDQQPQLLSRILSTLSYKPFDQDRFAITKERLARKLANAKDRKPFQQAISKTQNILISPSWSEEERLEALNSIDIKDIEVFRESFLAKLDVALLSSGNLSRSSTLNNTKLVESFLLKSSDKATVERAKINRLPNENLWLDRFSTSHSDTGFVHYIQGKDNSHKERAKYLLLTQVLASDYYNQIRTEKQLGYIVFATNFELLEVPGLAFIVQSPSSSGNSLFEETSKFLELSLEKVNDMNDADLNKHKSSVIANLLKQDNTLYARSNRFWKDIDIKNINFDTKEQLAKEIDSLTVADMTQAIKDISLQQNASLTVYTSAPEQPTAESMTLLSKKQKDQLTSF